jgi:ribosomal-protein-serine acetyltransferase
MDATQPPPLPDLPEELIGPRVIVRTWRMADAAELFAAVEESRERLSLWMTWLDQQRIPADAVAYCRRMSELWAARGGFPFGIWHRESGAFLGGTGLHNVNWSVPSIEIGYWLRNSAVGHGYVEEAVRLQLGFAFDQLGMERIALTCDPENARSRRIPEAIGFTLEGHLRRDIRMPNGALRDTLVYSILRDEWRVLAGCSARVVQAG